MPDDQHFEPRSATLSTNPKRCRCAEIRNDVQDKVENHRRRLLAALQTSSSHLQDDLVKHSEEHCATGRGQRATTGESDADEAAGDDKSNEGSEEDIGSMLAFAINVLSEPFGSGRMPAVRQKSDGGLAKPSMALAFRGSPEPHNSQSPVATSGVAGGPSSQMRSNTGNAHVGSANTHPASVHGNVRSGCERKEKKLPPALLELGPSDQQRIEEQMASPAQSSQTQSSVYVSCRDAAENSARSNASEAMHDVAENSNADIGSPFHLSMHSRELRFGLAGSKPQAASAHHGEDSRVAEQTPHPDSALLEPPWNTQHNNELPASSKPEVAKPTTQAESAGTTSDRVQIVNLRDLKQHDLTLLDEGVFGQPHRGVAATEFASKMDPVGHGARGVQVTADGKAGMTTVAGCSGVAGAHANPQDSRASFGRSGVVDGVISGGTKEAASPALLNPEVNRQLDFSLASFNGLSSASAEADRRALGPDAGRQAANIHTGAAAETLGANIHTGAAAETLGAMQDTRDTSSQSKARGSNQLAEWRNQSGTGEVGRHAPAMGAKSVTKKSHGDAGHNTEMFTIGTDSEGEEGEKRAVRAQAVISPNRNSTVKHINRLNKIVSTENTPRSQHNSDGNEAMGFEGHGGSFASRVASQQNHMPPADHPGACSSTAHAGIEARGQAPRTGLNALDVTSDFGGGGSWQESQVPRPGLNALDITSNFGGGTSWQESQVPRPGLNALDVTSNFGGSKSWQESRPEDTGGIYTSGSGSLHNPEGNCGVGASDIHESGQFGRYRKSNHGSSDVHGSSDIHESMTVHGSSDVHESGLLAGEASHGGRDGRLSTSGPSQEAGAVDASGVSDAGGQACSASDCPRDAGIEDKASNHSSGFAAVSSKALERNAGLAAGRATGAETPTVESSIPDNSRSSSEVVNMTPPRSFSAEIGSRSTEFRASLPRLQTSLPALPPLDAGCYERPAFASARPPRTPRGSEAECSGAAARAWSEDSMASYGSTRGRNQRPGDGVAPRAWSEDSVSSYRSARGRNPRRASSRDNGLLAKRPPTYFGVALPGLAVPEGGKGGKGGGLFGPGGGKGGKGAGSGLLGPEGGKGGSSGLPAQAQAPPRPPKPPSSADEEKKKESPPPKPSPTPKPNKGTPPPQKGTPPPKGKGKGAPPKGAPTAAGKGGTAKAEPRKPDVKPGVQVKKLYWNSFRLDNRNSNTVWNELDISSTNIDTAELETLFAEHAGGRSRSVARTAQPKITVRKIQVLEAQRRRQICIMLARLPDMSETRDAVLHMDKSRLNRDQVELLLPNLPSHDEVQLIQRAQKEHTIDESNVWDTAEDFVISMINIPQYQLRIQVWDFENSFDEFCQAIIKAETCLSCACDCLLTTTSIRHLLAIALLAGNYLNGGTPRGRADGFAIEALMQMRTVKMSQVGEHEGRPGSLVDYLVRQMEKKYPGELAEMAEPGKAMECIKAATRYKLGDVREEMLNLKRKCEQLLQRIQQSNVLSAEDDIFREHADILSLHASNMQELNNNFGKLDEKYLELRKWFNMDEKSNKMATDEFFGIWDKFFADINNSRKAMLEQEQKQAKAQRLASNRFPSRSRGSMATQRRNSTGCVRSNAEDGEPREPSNPRSGTPSTRDRQLAQRRTIADLDDIFKKQKEEEEKAKAELPVEASVNSEL